MEYIRGQRVRLAPGVEPPENKHGKVYEGVVDGQTPYGDIAVYFVGVGGQFFHPDELIPIGEPDPDAPPPFSGPGGPFPDDGGGF